jgi:uncharacterized protein
MPLNPTKVPLKVLPHASRNEIMGLKNGIWRIKIAAPADRGKANKELIDFISHTLGLKKEAVTILKGHTSHDKLISVEGLSETEIRQKLGGEARGA